MTYKDNYLGELLGLHLFTLEVYDAAVIGDKLIP
jgi:hypothetical protein